jgi:hypothetical protein
MWEDEGFGHYIAGQAGADSCFYIAVYRRKTRSYGIALMPEWAIAKTYDDEILKRMRAFLGVGKIEKQDPHLHNRRPYLRLRVLGSDCGTIVKFFERFPLRSNKRKDFEIWKRAVELYSSRKRVGGHSEVAMRWGPSHCWTRKELVEMLRLRKQLDDLPSRMRRRKNSATERELKRLEM